MNSADRSSEPRVPCRRLDAKRTMKQHVECPYCFGSEQEIASRDWQRYCSFEPGVDPIVFGFPSDCLRYRNS